jgi:hypothetical protein
VRVLFVSKVAVVRLGVHSMSNIPFSNLDMAIGPCTCAAGPECAVAPEAARGFNRDCVAKRKHLNNPSV